MFGECKKLVGGNGTRYSDDHTDITYACVDGGSNAPGYFTAKDPSIIPPSPDDSEAYAVLGNNNRTLVFYYDNKKKDRNGMGIGPFTHINQRGWNDYTSDITIVAFDESFANCTNLESTCVWFAGCNNLQIITGIGNLKTDNVTNMVDMFANCTSLTAIDVSHFNTEKVTEMRSMFMGCESLKELNLSCFNTSKVYNMAYMFSRCSSLSNLDLSSFNTANVVSMDYMFAECKGLTDVNISSFDTHNVKEMAGLFQRCTALKELDLQSFDTRSVSNMTGMFAECTGIQTIIVDNEWTTDQVQESSGMFYMCTSLVGGDGTQYDVNYTDKTKAYAGLGGYLTMEGQGGENEPGIDIDLEHGWYGLIDKKLVRSYSSEGEWMMLQSNGYLVIGKDAWNGYNCVLDAYIDPDDSSVLLFDFTPNTYKKVIIKSNGTVKMLDENHKNEEVPAGTYTIADGAADYDHIGDNTFRAETSEGLLMRFKILDEESKTVQVFTICEPGTNGIGSFTSQAISTNTDGIVTIPSVVNAYTVVEIGDNAFKECKSVSSVIIPNSVTSIGVGAFANCTSLQSISIPEGVRGIGNSAFSGCSGLLSVTLPESLASLGNSTFSGCVNLATIVMPRELYTIGYRAFYKCSSLTSVTIPLNIVNDGGLVFEQCTGLKEIIIPNGVKTIGASMFRHCDSMVSFDLPSSVTEIGVGAFSYCVGLKSIVIPEKVEIIPEATFMGCSNLAIVKVGNNLKKVEKQAFSFCSSLADFYCPTMEVPYAEQDAFKFNGYCYNSTATLHVQVGTKNQYAIADVWKDFKNIVEHTEIITGDANSDSKVDIVDVTMTISEILGQNPTGFNKTAADVNGDGRVDIVDVTSIIDIILKAK